MYIAMESSSLCKKNKIDFVVKNSRNSFEKDKRNTLVNSLFDIEVKL